MEVLGSFQMEDIFFFIKVKIYQLKGRGVGEVIVGQEVFRIEVCGRNYNGIIYRVGLGFFGFFQNFDGSVKSGGNF